MVGIFHPHQLLHTHHQIQHALKLYQLCQVGITSLILGQDQLSQLHVQPLNQFMFQPKHWLMKRQDATGRTIQVLQEQTESKTWHWALTMLLSVITTLLSKEKRETLIAKSRLSKKFSPKKKHNVISKIIRRQQTKWKSKKFKKMKKVLHSATTGMLSKE